MIKIIVKIPIPFLLRFSGAQRARPRRVPAGDQPGEAALGQEEEGGDAPEARGQDDEDHEPPVSSAVQTTYRVRRLLIRYYECCLSLRDLRLNVGRSVKQLKPTKIIFFR